MVDLNNPYQHEDRARAATLLFIKEAITEPLTNIQGEVTINPELAMAYLIEDVADRDSHKLHRICRLAWAKHTMNPNLSRWGCIWAAKIELEIDARTQEVDGV